MAKIIIIRRLAKILTISTKSGIYLNAEKLIYSTAPILT